MPYITQEERPLLDSKIDLLAPYILHWGQLNYIITKLVVAKMRAPGLGLKWGYTVLLLGIGTLFMVALELYRRVAAPYEDQKIKENGDVFDE